MVITRTISRLDSRTLRPVNVLRILVFIIINVKIMVTLSQKNAAGALYKTLCQNLHLTLCNKIIELHINLYFRGDSFAIFLRNSQHLYASSLVTFERQTPKL